MIVGSGPAGAWAALRLAEAGVAATIIERGKPVGPRRADSPAFTADNSTPNPITVSAKAVRAPTPTASSTRGARIGIGRRRAGRFCRAGRAGRHRGRGAAAHRIESLAQVAGGAARSLRVWALYHFDCAFLGVREEQGRIRAVRTSRGKFPLTWSCWRPANRPATSRHGLKQPMWPWNERILPWGCASSTRDR